MFLYTFLISLHLHVGVLMVTGGLLGKLTKLVFHPGGGGGGKGMLQYTLLPYAAEALGNSSSVRKLT